MFTATYTVNLQMNARINELWSPEQSPSFLA